MPESILDLRQTITASYGKPMARLVLLSEGLTGRTFELKVEKTTVGRVEDNAFQIPETSVSSHHAEILLRGSDVVIKDLDSTNGSLINGEKVTEAVLKPGQILRLGMIEMRLETGDAALGSRPAPPEGTRPSARRSSGSSWGPWMSAMSRWST